MVENQDTSNLEVIKGKVKKDMLVHKGNSSKEMKSETILQSFGSKGGQSRGGQVNTGDALNQPMLQGFLPDLRGSGTREICIGDRLGYNKRVFPALGLQYTRAILR